MMARIEAEGKVPGGGPMTEFSSGEAPQVRAGDIRGRAVADTWHHGLIEWTESRGKYHFDWFPAELIKRVQDRDQVSNTIAS